MSRFGLAIALCIGCAWAGTSAAHGTLETYGTDPRSAAMGNAVTAGGAGFTAAHTNPANLTKSRRAEIGGGFLLSLPQLSFDAETPRPADDPLSFAPANPYSGFLVGFAIPIDLVVNDRVFIGATGFFPSYALVKARAHDPARPFAYLYDSAPDHFELATAVGVRIFDWLSVGGGLRFGAHQSGRVNIALDPVRRRVTDQTLDTEQATLFSPEAGVTVGPLGLAGVLVTVGGVWREPTRFPISLPAALLIDGADVGAALDIVTVANFSPRTFAVGGTVDVVTLPGLKARASLDAVYGMWSEAPPPFFVTSTRFEGEGLEKLGLEGAIDTPGEGQERVVPPGLRDTVTVRAGAEVRLLDDRLALRAGYQYRPTPVPDQTSGTNIVDATAHVLATGAGFSVLLPGQVLDHPIDIDLAVQTQLWEPRTATKARADDPVGDWTASGAAHGLSLAFRYAF